MYRTAIPFRLFSATIMLIYATGTLGIPTPIIMRNGQDKPPPTFFSIPMNLSPGIGMPNFNQVPKNITDLLYMLENNAELSPATRSSIVADLFSGTPASVNKFEKDSNKKVGKPATVTLEPVEKKSDNKRKVNESSPQPSPQPPSPPLPQTVSAQKDKLLVQHGKPETNYPTTGYEESEEYHVEEKRVKEEEKVISVPVNMTSTMKDLLSPKMEEPKTNSKSSPSKDVLHVAPKPGKAKMVAAVKSAARKNLGKEERETNRETSPKENAAVSKFERPDPVSFDKLGRGAGSQSQSRNMLAGKEGRIVAVSPAILADILNDFKAESNKVEPETRAVPVLEKSTQTEGRIPSLPPPNRALLVDFLKNIVPKLETLDLPQDKSTEKEDNKQNSIPPRITDMLNSFESILNDSQKLVKSQPQSRFHTVPAIARRPSDMAIPILTRFDSGLGEPGQDRSMMPDIEQEEEPLRLPEPVAAIVNAFLRPDSRFDELKQEAQPAEKDTDFEPLVSSEEKKIFHMMFAKHTTFKLQIHMKVWHMFFSYVSRDPLAAEDCTAILTHVSKFYKQLTIDVEVVQKFRVLHKINRMMTHNDQKLKTFFEKTAKQPPTVDLERMKSMDDIQNTEKWQNEMVANLWKDAMSHFDEKLEHVENFFNDVLANHERADSELDLPAGMSRKQVEYLMGGGVTSRNGDGFSIVDTEITKIRMRRKIYREPNPFSLQSMLNEGLAAMKQF